MSEQLAIKISKVCCNRLLLAYSSKFVTLTFVFVSQTIFCCEAVLRPLACCARRKLPPSAPRLVTPLKTCRRPWVVPLPSNRWHLSCDGCLVARREDRSELVRAVLCTTDGCLVAKGKGKVFPYSLPNVGPGADPGVQAVSPQVT